MTDSPFTHTHTAAANSRGTITGGKTTVQHGTQQCEREPAGCPSKRVLSRDYDDSNAVPEIALAEESPSTDRLQAWQFQDGTVGIRATGGIDTAIIYLSPDSVDDLTVWLPNSRGGHDDAEDKES